MFTGYIFTAEVIQLFSVLLFFPFAGRFIYTKSDSNLLFVVSQYKKWRTASNRHNNISIQMQLSVSSSTTAVLHHRTNRSFLYHSAHSLSDVFTECMLVPSWHYTLGTFEKWLNRLQWTRDQEKKCFICLSVNLTDTIGHGVVDKKKCFFILSKISKTKLISKARLSSSILSASCGQRCPLAAILHPVCVNLDKEAELWVLSTRTSGKKCLK